MGYLPRPAIRMTFRTDASASARPSSFCSVRPFSSASATAQQDIEQAAVWTMLPRQVPTNLGSSTGPRPQKATRAAAVPRRRLDVPHQGFPWIAGNVMLQSSIFVPRALPWAVTRSAWYGITCTQGVCPIFMTATFHASNVPRHNHP